MEKHGLRLISTEGMTRTEWLQERMSGVGGSDISSILGLNHRFPAIELFYQKVGMVPNSTEENEAMFWGSRNEDTVLKIAQYYDFDTAQYISNFNADTKLRTITKLPYMVNNPEIPWIIGNLDGAEDFDADTFMMDGPAESKTISRQTVEMWEDGIPPYHIIQIMTYCMVCAPMMRGDTASIYYLQDGNKFAGFRIPIVPSVCDKIVTLSRDFWERVVKGREIMATVKDNDTRLKYLSQIEPEYDNSEEYKKFLSKLFLLKQNMIRLEGTREDYENAVAYKLLAAEIKTLDEKRQLYQNKIMQRMHHNHANGIDFLGKGKVTYNKKLYVNIREQL